MCQRSLVIGRVQQAQPKEFCTRGLFRRGTRQVLIDGDAANGGKHSNASDQAARFIQLLQLDPPCVRVLATKQ